MKISLIIFSLFTLNISHNCFAVDSLSLPNPWRNQTSSDETDESEVIFFDAIRVNELTKKQCCDYAKERESKEILKRNIRESSLKGNIKAQLVDLALFNSNARNNEKVLSIFKYIDQCNDPKLLYEVGKLMEFNYLLCMNVLNEDGESKVERRCLVSKNERPGFLSAYDESAGLILQENRLQRSFGYILKAANLNYPPAQYEIGYRMLKDKKNIPLNGMSLEGMINTKAEEWLKKSSEAGNTDATLLIEETQKIAQLEAALIAKTRSIEKGHEDAKPKCANIVFSGIAAAGSPYSIEQVLRSKDIEDSLARNPIICEYSEWGGHYGQNGGIIGRNRGTECRGVNYFKNKKATILNWSDKFYYIETDVDFDTGRRSMNLHIRRSDAKCTK